MTVCPWSVFLWPLAFPWAQMPKWPPGLPAHISVRLMLAYKLLACGKMGSSGKKKGPFVSGPFVQGRLFRLLILLEHLSGDSPALVLSLLSPFVVLLKSASCIWCQDPLIPVPVRM